MSNKIGMKEKKGNEKKWYVRIVVMVLSVLQKKGNNILIRGICHRVLSEVKDLLRTEGTIYHVVH